MKTLSQNIVPLVLRGLPPLNKLDQSMMRKLRKLADLTGWTVEEPHSRRNLEMRGHARSREGTGNQDHQIPTPMPLAYKAKIK
jgi:hypothetical protein